jgi:hypothetical protein
VDKAPATLWETGAPKDKPLAAFHELAPPIRRAPCTYGRNERTILFADGYGGKTGPSLSIFAVCSGGKRAAAPNAIVAELHRLLEIGGRSAPQIHVMRRWRAY